MMTTSVVNYAQLPVFAAENTGNQNLTRAISFDGKATLTVGDQSYDISEFTGTDTVVKIKKDVKTITFHVEGNDIGRTALLQMGSGATKLNLHKENNKGLDLDIECPVEDLNLDGTTKYRFTLSTWMNDIIVQKQMKFEVDDTPVDQAPVIEVPNAKNDRITIEQGSYFDIRDFKNEIVVTDDNTPETELRNFTNFQVTGNVSTTTVGNEYPITITVKDNEGNVTTKIITAEIVPARVPVKMTVTVDGKTFDVLKDLNTTDKPLVVDPNVEELVFHVDGSILVRSELTGSVNNKGFTVRQENNGKDSVDLVLTKDKINETTTYRITPFNRPGFMVSDYRCTFKIKFAEPDQAPVIEVPSAKDDRITVEQGSNFDTRDFRKEIVVTDDNTPTSEIKIQVSANVRTSTLGEYQITITVTDNVGNVTTKVITAEVVPARVPVKATVVANGETVDILNDVNTEDKLLVVNPDDEELVFHVDGSTLIYSTIHITDGYKTVKTIRVDNEGKDSVDIVVPKELINENYSYEIATFARSGIANNINFFKIKLNEQTPVTPVDPVDPDTPVTPVNPDTPVVPETPVTPVVPETPVTPTNPDDELNGDVLGDKVIGDNDNNNNNANNSNDINVDKEDESLDSNVLGDKINNKSQPKSKHVQTSDNQDALGFMVAGIVAIIGLSVLIKRKKYN